MDSQVQIDTKTSELVSRVNYNIPMYAFEEKSWAAGDTIGSEQISACTFVAIYDQDQFIAAHIPPGQLQPQEVDESPLIAWYLNKFTSALRQHPLSGMKGGYFFHRTSLPEKDQRAIKNMFSAHGIVPKVKPYTYQPGSRGYGVVVSRTREELTFNPDIRESLMRV